jgi:hypothetical protein
MIRTDFLTGVFSSICELLEESIDKEEDDGDERTGKDVVSMASVPSSAVVGPRCDEAAPGAGTIRRFLPADSTLRLGPTKRFLGIRPASSSAADSIALSRRANRLSLLVGSNNETSSMEGSGGMEGRFFGFAECDMDG